MAIGWGKSFEEQVEEGNQRISSHERELRLPPEARIRQKRLETLKLSRSRMLQQLERAKHKAHRDVLMKGLAAMEKQIDDVLGNEAPPR